MVEVLWACYEHRENVQVVAMSLGTNADDPLFRMDLNQLYKVGAIEQADMPMFGKLDPPEVYRVTQKGGQILREWNSPIGP